MPLHSLPDPPQITIRPIRADDGERLRASHARLSPESRYRRFLAAKPELSPADARYLVEIDGCDHFALVATVQDVEGEMIVAVARYIRAPDDRRTAEFAIVVGDEYQHQGLGGELLARLGEAAVVRGVRRFRATMLADNVAIHRLVHGFAGPGLEQERLGEISEVEFDLPARAGDMRRARFRSHDIPGTAPAMIAGCAGS